MNTGYGNRVVRQQRREVLLRWGFLLVAVGALGAGTFWYFNPQARPGWVSERLPTAPTATITAYRWKDDRGQWVIGDQAPADGRPYEIVEYRHDTNEFPYNPTPEE